MTITKNAREMLQILRHLSQFLEFMKKKVFTAVAIRNLNWQHSETRGVYAEFLRPNVFIAKEKEKARETKYLPLKLCNQYLFASVQGLFSA